MYFRLFKNCIMINLFSFYTKLHEIENTFCFNLNLIKSADFFLHFNKILSSKHYIHIHYTICVKSFLFFLVQSANGQLFPRKCYFFNFCRRQLNFNKLGVKIVDSTFRQIQENQYPFNTLNHSRI